MDWLERRVKLGKIHPGASIISIHGFNTHEWRALIERAVALRPIAIELNLSCPNVGEVSWPDDLFAAAHAASSASGVGVIAKVPPIRYEHMVAAALGGGITGFHCCNTLPVRSGGLSGKPLLGLSLACIGRVREMTQEAGREAFIIGGGGVTEPGDIDRYAKAGADRVAIGTKAMNPRLLLGPGPIRGLLEQASRVLVKGL